MANKQAKPKIGRPSELKDPVAFRFYMEGKQKRKLVRLAKQRKTTISHLVRQAITNEF